MNPRLSRRRTRTRQHRSPASRPAPVVVERGRTEADRAAALIVREFDAVEVEADDR